MLDLNQLQKLVPVITVKEYLLLHDLDPSLEVHDGYWVTERYQGPKTDTFTIPNDSLSPFEPHGIVRVDRLPAKPNPYVPIPLTKARHVYNTLWAHLSDDTVIAPSDALEVLKSLDVQLPGGPNSDDEKLVEIMNTYGFGALYTYHTRCVHRSAQF